MDDAAQKHYCRLCAAEKCRRRVSFLLSRRLTAGVHDAPHHLGYGAWFRFAGAAAVADFFRRMPRAMISFLSSLTTLSFISVVSVRTGTVTATDGAIV